MGLVDYDVLTQGRGVCWFGGGLCAGQSRAKGGLGDHQPGLGVELPFTPIARPFPAGSLLADVGEEGLKGWELHSRAKYKLETTPTSICYSFR